MKVTIYAFVSQVARNTQNFEESLLVGVANTATEYQEMTDHWLNEAKSKGSPFQFLAYYDEQDNPLNSYEKAYLALNGDPIFLFPNIQSFF